ncbi:MAG: oxidoreductase [Candidatus Marinimicrobia bacterium]|nr:oxidoreductase [Candidatus Neomarinimicrobiota bacterium]|tara:strand:- start:9607 stop:10620 length:1014 start_codon:yes stop_codon:yes gene_type:complete
MKKLKVAIIGCGVVGKRRKSFILKNKNYQLVAVSDICFKRDLFRKGEINYYKKYLDLLKTESLDAVFITLPNYLASKVTIDCIKKRIHVFCEKPPAKNLIELKKVFKIHKKHPRIKLKYGFNHRYHSSIQLAKKIIKTKKFGKLQNFRCLYGKSKIVTYEKGEWRSKKRFAGGGILLDQGIHVLDLLRFFNGDFNEFKGFISNRYWKYDIEDNAFALMRDKKGIVASIHSSATQWQHKFRMEITLEKALIELNGILSGSKSYGKESLNLIAKKKSSKGSKIIKKFFFNKDNSWKNEIEEFSNIIQKNKKVITGNIKDAIKVMAMVEKIYSSDRNWKK